MMMMAGDRKISDFTEVASSKILLEETFYVLSKKNTVFRVQLSASGLCLLKESSDIVKKQTIHIKDIIGCQCMRSKRRSRSAASCVCQSLPRTPALKVVDENSSEQDETDTSAYLYIYAYILQSSRRGAKKRERTIITLRFRSFDKYEDNYREAQRWRSVIRTLMNGQQIAKTPSLTEIMPTVCIDDRKLLIFLNPKSGAGKGRLVFQQRVVPVLQEAEMQFDLHITKYANYAREFVRTNNVFHWRAIVMIGGDGILFEVLNGIFERPDWLDVIQKMPIGIIPSGSGNGLARTICHCFNEPYATNSVLAAALSVVRKNTSPMDVVRVETTNSIMYSFLSVGWGLISDIDIESERFRAIGGQRFTVWSVARLLDLRTYKGKLWYLPIGENVQISALPTQHHHNDNETEIPEEVNLETIDATTETRQRLDSWYSATSRRSAYFSATGSSYQSMIDSTSGDPNGTRAKIHMYGPASQMPALTAPIPSHWTYIEGNFVMVHAAYQTHLGEDCLFAPNSRLNDGIIWLVILHAGLTRSQLLTFLLALSSGTHLDPDNAELIQMIAVRAFRLEPEEGTTGHVTVDGELVEYGPIQAEVFPGLANIMVP